MAIWLVSAADSSRSFQYLLLGAIHLLIAYSLVANLFDNGEDRLPHFVQILCFRHLRQYQHQARIVFRTALANTLVTFLVSTSDLYKRPAGSVVRILASTCSAGKSSCDAGGV